MRFSIFEETWAKVLCHFDDRLLEMFVPNYFLGPIEVNIICRKIVSKILLESFELLVHVCHVR